MSSGLPSWWSRRPLQRPPTSRRSGPAQAKRSSSNETCWASAVASAPPWGNVAIERSQHSLRPRARSGRAHASHQRRHEGPQPAGIAQRRTVPEEREPRLETREPARRLAGEGGIGGERARRLAETGTAAQRHAEEHVADDEHAVGGAPVGAVAGAVPGPPQAPRAAPRTALLQRPVGGGERRPRRPRGAEPAERRGGRRALAALDRRH